jgi:hypothetical protein
MLVISLPLIAKWLDAENAMQCQITTQSAGVDPKKSIASSKTSQALPHFESVEDQRSASSTKSGAPSGTFCIRSRQRMCKNRPYFMLEKKCQTSHIHVLLLRPLARGPTLINTHDIADSQTARYGVNVRPCQITVLSTLETSRKSTNWL